MTGDLRRMSVVLFEGFELLEVFGPVELFSLVPGHLAIEFTGPGAGPVAVSVASSAPIVRRMSQPAGRNAAHYPGRPLQRQGHPKIVSNRFALSAISGARP